MDLDTDGPPEQVELTRDPFVAARWSVLAAVLLVAAGWLVADSRGHPLSWALLFVAVVISAFFLVQLLSRDAVRLRLGPDRIDSSVFGWRTSIAWEAVHIARVRRVAGEPILVLDVREPGRPDGGSRRRVTAVVVPLGSDVDVLHETLERRIGRGPDRPPAPAPGT